MFCRCYGSGLCQVLVLQFKQLQFFNQPPAIPPSSALTQTLRRLGFATASSAKPNSKHPHQHYSCSLRWSWILLCIPCPYQGGTCSNWSQIWFFTKGSERTNSATVLVLTAVCFKGPMAAPGCGLERGTVWMVLLRAVVRSWWAEGWRERELK